MKYLKENKTKNEDLGKNSNKSLDGFQEALNISDEKLGEYYETACKILEEYRWDDAADAFLFLLYLNPYVEAFWKGLATARHSEEKFGEACAAYEMAAKLNPEDPFLQFHLFQCYLTLENRDEAKKAFRRCLELCGNDPDYLELKTQLLEFLK